MKIMIGVLNQGWIHTKLTETLLKIQSNTEHELKFLFSDEKPIDYNRNFIVDKFLETDCEILFMMDSDMVIPENIFDMIKPGYDVVSAVVFTTKKGIPYPIIMKKAKDDFAFVQMADPNDAIEEYTEVDGIGTGCIYIRRSVFDKIDRPFFRFQYAIDGSVELGEDYSFSNKIKAADINLSVATKFIVGHYKSFDVSHINQLLYKGLTLNKNGIAQTLVNRMDASAAKKINRRLKDGT